MNENTKLELQLKKEQTKFYIASLAFLSTIIETCYSIYEKSITSATAKSIMPDRGADFGNVLFDKFLIIILIFMFLIICFYVLKKCYLCLENYIRRRKYGWQKSRPNYPRKKYGGT